MLPLQITVAFISPPKKITTKKHVQYHVSSNHLNSAIISNGSVHPTSNTTNRRLPRHPGWFQSSLAFEPQSGARTWGFLGRPIFQHRMGRQCFRKGKVFNPPPKKKIHLKTNKSWNLKRMVFPNKESPDLEAVIFKIQCSFFGGRQLRFHTHPLTLCKMQFTKTFGFS